MADGEEQEKKPKRAPAPRLTVDEARALMRAHLAASVREMSVREVIGLEEYGKYAEGKTALKRLQDAKDWVAREIENIP